MIERAESVGNGVVTEVSTEVFRGNRGVGTLLEREGELAELDGLLADAREGRGRLSLIEGEAGIGKTRLLGEARERALAQGLTVLAARGGELERDFGFGIVRQLLEPARARAEATVRAELLAGAASLAEPVFKSAPQRDTGADPTHPVLHGLYWLTANLAERSPLLLAIDDIQWADQPSLRFLIHLARRLDGMHAALLLVSRAEERPEQPVLRSLLLEARPPILHPSPLSESAIRTLLQAALGADPGPKLGAACHEATGGNPFLLSELVEELREQSTVGGAISPVAVSGLGPDRIAVAILLRVGRIDPSAAALVRALAVLGARATLADAAELAGLDLAKARSIAASLAEAAVLEAGEPLQFTHPIVRAAIYEEMAAAERSTMHHSAAELLADQGAEPEAIAVHLLACEPAGDPARVATLREAGRAAIARGAAETAVHYLRRALAEPPPDAVRPELLLELGSAAARTGERDGIALMREGFELTTDPRSRAAAALELGNALGWAAHRMDEAVLVLERGLESAGESGLATEIEATMLLCGTITTAARPRLAERLREARARVGRLEGEIPPPVFAPVALDVAISGGTAAEAARLANLALAGGALVRDLVERDLPGACPPVWVLIQAGELDTVEATMGEIAPRTQARGSPLGFAIASGLTAFARHRAGDLGPAEASARTCLELAAEVGWGLPAPVAAASLASVLVERGDLDGARAVLAQLEGAYDPELATAQALRESRAKLLVAEGNLRGALDELLAIARWEEAMELPGGVVPVQWRSAAALAHAALDDADKARGLAEDEVALARGFGAARAVGIALRAFGLVESGERGLALLEEAAGELEDSADRLEHARALVDWGAALRRAGRTRDARRRLAEGMDLAHRSGATALVNRAHEELTLAGARPRRVALSGLDALTPSEHRVCEMAAAGMTNKEIAQALFVTLRTVEMHLSNAYRKLEIDSRHGLPEALAAGQPAQA
jgi:DNA-binding CsgD family transcriptional regulator